MTDMDPMKLLEKWPLVALVLLAMSAWPLMIAGAIRHSWEMAFLGVLAWLIVEKYRVDRLREDVKKKADR